MSRMMMFARLRDRFSYRVGSNRRESGRKNSLGLERLEDRILLADVSWTNASGGSWLTGSNWSSGTVPKPEDRALITLDGQYTVTLDADVTVAGLTLGGASGTQSLNTGSHTVTINGPGTIAPHGLLLLGEGTMDGTGT